MTLSTARLDQLLAEFPRLHIGLLGDLFLDRYLELEEGVHELSIETGLEAYQVATVRNQPGALGTVLNNLVALGVGRLTPLTVIGDDGHGYDLVRALPPAVATSCVIRDPERLTPTYTKPLRRQDGEWVELNRLDVRTRAPLTERTVAEVAERLRALWREVDGLIVLDQVAAPECGVVPARIREVLAELTRQDPSKLMLIDSRAQLGQFSRGVLKGNRAELAGAAGLASDAGDDSLFAGLRQLAAKTGETVLCTDGPRGIWIQSADSPAPELATGVRVEGPIDIVGAGDAATSGMVAARLAGANWIEAAGIGNLAAAVTVRQLGTTGQAHAGLVREMVAGG